MMDTHALHSNIWKFGVHLATNKRTYLPFLSIFLLTFPNTTAQTIGFWSLVGVVAGIIFEVPSGYISDSIGHQRALVIARTLVALSTACYLFAQNYWWFYLGSGLLSAGMAFASGTGAAFMHNTLAALGTDDQYARIMGKLKSLGFAVPVIFILALSFIADFDYRWALVGALIIDCIGLLAVVLMFEPPTQVQVDEIDVHSLRSSLREFFTNAWLPFMTISVLTIGILLGATAGFRTIYFDLLGFSITAIGFYWAISRVCISLLLLTNGRMYEYFTFRGLWIFRMTVFVVCMIGIGLIPHPLTVMTLFLIANTFMWGTSSATSQFVLGYIKHSQSKATLLSYRRLLENGVFGLTAIIMGALVEAYSYQQAFLFVGFAMVALLVAAFFLPRGAKTI